MAAKIIALHTKHAGRLSVDSAIEVIHRVKATHKIGVGWNYRFKSGKEWVLVPLDETAHFVFDEEPEGNPR